jgi:hypothetical protein
LAMMMPSSLDFRRNCSPAPMHNRPNGLSYL